jgi:hypothetical protein
VLGQSTKGAPGAVHRGRVGEFVVPAQERGSDEGMHTRTRAGENCFGLTGSMKAVIAECVDVVRAKRPATSPEELAQALMKDDDDDTTDRTSLPWNAPTP